MAPAVASSCVLVLLVTLIAWINVATVGAVPPAKVVDLREWKLQLPVASGSGGRKEVTQPQLANYELANYFFVQGNRVVFRCPAGGYKGGNSKTPRTELREVDSKGKETGWSLRGSTLRVLELDGAVTQLPGGKPEIVIAQIHAQGKASPFIPLMIRVLSPVPGNPEPKQGLTIWVNFKGPRVGTLTTTYKPGTPFKLKIAAGRGGIQVWWNGQKKFDLKLQSSGLHYYKAGLYLQTNTKWDKHHSYGEAWFSSIKLYTASS